MTTEPEADVTAACAPSSRPDGPDRVRASSRTSTKRARRHAAATSRVVVAGLSASAGLGLVALFGSTRPAPSATAGAVPLGAAASEAGTSASPPPPVVVIRRIHVPVGSEAVTAAGGVATGAAGADAVGVASRGPAPVRRTTAPTVRSSAS